MTFHTVGSELWRIPTESHKARYSLVGVKSVSVKGPTRIATTPKANKAKIALRANKPREILIHRSLPLHPQRSVSLIRTGQLGGDFFAYGTVLFQSLVPKTARKKYLHGAMVVLPTVSELLVP